MALLHLRLSTEEKVMVTCSKDCFLISKDQAHKRRLEIFDFLILSHDIHQNLESQTNPSNGMDFEILLASPRVAHRILRTSAHGDVS
jgi:hypothetical protein